MIRDTLISQKTILHGNRRSLRIKRRVNGCNEIKKKKNTTGTLDTRRSRLQVSQPSPDDFQKLLEANAQTFYPARTSKALLAHWQLMKQYHLLPDQTVQSLPRGESVLNFSDAEDLINDAELVDQRDEVLDAELQMTDRKNKKEIRMLENELGRWQVLVDNVTGNTQPDFDNQTLAILRGRLVRYLMRSREVS